MPHAPPARLRIGLPAAAFLAVPLVEIVRSLAVHDYVQRAYVVHGQTLLAMKWGCWLLAAALASWPAFRKWLLRNVDGSGSPSAPWRRWGPVAVSLEFTALLCFLTYCRYRGSQFPLDTAAIVQRAYDTLQGDWFQSSIFGCNAFSYHFAFTLDLFSPLLLIWRSSAAFLMLQCLALGSMGLAVYHLVYRLTKSSCAGFAGMLLVYSCPAYAQMCASRLDDSVFLAPFLLWALVFMEYDRWVLCGVFMALAATTREHFPFTLMGLGVYAAFRRGRPTRSTALAGAAIIALAVALFLVEMKLVFSFPDTLGYQRASWDGYFHRYGFAGTDHLGFFAFLLRHPLGTFLKTVTPFGQTLPALNLILYAALLPLAAPLQLIPFAVAVVPQLMTEAGPLHDMLFNYPSLVFGLLMFAAAYGIARVHRLLKERRWEEFMLIPVLLVGGFGFKASANPLLPDWETPLFDSTKGIPDLIPPDASVWTDEYLGAWVAPRTRLKLAAGFPEFDREDFSRKLFKPDFVMLEIGWLIRNESREPILLYLADHHYVLYGKLPGIIVVKAPDEPQPEESSAPVELPVPTAEQALAFHHFMIVFQHILAGDHLSAKSYRGLTPEQRRIEEYCVYLTGGDSNPISLLLKETAVVRPRQD